MAIFFEATNFVIRKKEAFPDYLKFHLPKLIGVFLHFGDFNMQYQLFLYK
jgi:hypothetical protein